MVNRGIVVLIFSLCGSAVLAQQTETSLFSPSTADLIAAAAVNRYEYDPWSASAVDQAMVLLSASLSLNDQVSSTREVLLRVSATASASSKDYSTEVYNALRRYVDDRANVATAKGAIAYLLSRENTRVDREALLIKLTRVIGARNAVLHSDLLTQLALLEIERADTGTALQHLDLAYRLNPYNLLSFTLLAELAPSSVTVEIPQSVFAGQLRRGIEMNPFDISLALAYADYLRQLEMYEYAAQAYTYCLNLASYLKWDQPLSETILVPLALSAFQTERSRADAVAAAEQFRKTGRFSLTLESIAGLAAVRMGRTDEGRQLLQDAANRAETLLQRSPQGEMIEPAQLCWFYSFVLPDPEKALARGHEAFSRDPNDPEIKALFAHALAVNGQQELAGEYLDSIQQNNQIAEYTRGVILMQKDKAAAIETLKNSVKMRTESIVAWRARQLLSANGSEYISPISPDEIANSLRGIFGTALVPDFKTPSHLIRPKISFSGNQYLYSGEINAQIVIENSGSRNIIIDDRSMFTGLVRMDAEIRGDIKASLPNFLRTVIQPGRVIQPGEHVIMEIDCMKGRLHRILRTYPQADLEIEFTMWLDPVEDAQGNVRSRWEDIPPLKQTIRRSKVQLTGDFLMQRLETLSRGMEGQKVRAAELFTGLLAEQHAANQEKLPYKYIKAEPDLLSDAIRRLLADDDWNIRAQTLTAMTDVEFPMEYALIKTISDNLKHEKWPVRLMALYVLNGVQSRNFQVVLDWNAQYDAEQLVREMAVALGGRAKTPAKTEQMVE